MKEGRVERKEIAIFGFLPVVKMREEMEEKPWWVVLGPRPIGYPVSLTNPHV